MNGVSYFLSFQKNIPEGISGTRFALQKNVNVDTMFPKDTD